VNEFKFLLSINSIYFSGTRTINPALEERMPRFTLWAAICPLFCCYFAVVDFGTIEFRREFLYIFENGNNKPKFYSLWNCLLPFISEHFVFTSAAWKRRDENMHTCNSACSFVWVWNLVADLREGRGLRVFGNMMLRRIFGPEKDEIIWGWRKLHKHEPRYL
jgi:hypothetical protein